MYKMTDLRVSANDRTILAVDELSLGENTLTVILGHNGSGKSTLMKVLARQVIPATGTVTLAGKPLTGYSQKQLARQVAFLQQHLPDATGLTVRELVALGRFPWRGIFGQKTVADQRVIDTAMRDTHTDHYASHMVDQLSGGERQRAWIAMLLAQQSPMLLLDEPVSALDLAHQYEVMTLLKNLCMKKQCGVAVILHDINLAVRYADHIIGLKQGQIAFNCQPDQLFSDSRLSQLYGLDLEFIDSPKGFHKIAVVAESTLE